MNNKPHWILDEFGLPTGVKYGKHLNNPVVIVKIADRKVPDKKKDKRYEW